MKIITVHFSAMPEKRNEVLKLCNSMVAPSRSEPGCISYTLFQDVSDSNKFFFYEEWKDQQAVDYHFATSHFKSFQPQFERLIEGSADLKIHSTT